MENNYEETYLNYINNDPLFKKEKEAIIDLLESKGLNIDDIEKYYSDNAPDGETSTWLEKSALGGLKNREQVITTENLQAGNFLVYPAMRGLSDKVFYCQAPSYASNLVLKISDLVREKNDPSALVVAKKDLAGDLTEEWWLDHKGESYSEELVSVVKDVMYSNFQKLFADVISQHGDIVEINFARLWTNYYKPNEYNGKHTHGGILSFVWYLDIPEEIREEHILQSRTGNSANRGLISFYSRFIGGQMLTFNPKKNDIFIFESSHEHSVAPYKSDCTRISFAGNIHSVVFKSGLSLTQNEMGL